MRRRIFDKEVYRKEIATIFLESWPRVGSRRFMRSRLRPCSCSSRAQRRGDSLTLVTEACRLPLQPQSGTSMALARFALKTTGLNIRTQ